MGGRGRCERRSKVFLKKLNRGGGGSGRGGVGLGGGQGRCEWRSFCVN